MACWHGGRKVKFPFGERLRTGDIVRVTLNLHQYTLSISINGHNFGVALERLTKLTKGGW